MPSTAVPATDRHSSFRAALARLNPIAFFLGPVFEKEVRVGGRRLSTYVYRAFAAFVLFIVILTTALTNLPAASDGGTAERLQSLQNVAPSIAYVIGWVQLIALTILSPVLIAPALCEERRSKTLAALLTTPLTARQIVFGTLAGRWMQIIILALIAAPLLFGLRVLGGVPAWFVFAMTAIILSTSFVGAACGILCSAVVARPASAIFIAVLLTVLSLFAPPLLLYYARIDLGLPVPQWAILISSGPISLGSLYGSLSDGGLRDAAIRTTLGTTAWNIGLAGVYSLFTIALLRRVMRTEGGALPARAGSKPLLDAAAPTPAASASEAAPITAPPPTAPDGVALAAALAASTDAAAPLPASAEDRALRLAAASRSVGDNPVLWRELRQSVFVRRWHAVFLVFILIALLAWIATESWGDILAHMPAQIIGMIIIIAQAALSTVGGITTERETKSWEVLVAAPLSARQILFGKIAGALRRQILIPSVLLAYLFVVGVIPGQIHPVALFHIVLIWLGTTALFAGTGVCLSLRLTKTSSAASVNLGIAVLFWILFPLSIAMAQGFAGRFIPNAWFEHALTVASHLNPVLLIGSAVDGAFDRNWRWSPSFDYNLPGSTGGMHLFTFTVSCVGYAFFAALLGLAAAWYATLRFNKLAGRAS